MKTYTKTLTATVAILLLCLCSQAQLTISTAPDTTICSGGTAHLAVYPANSGTPPYTYQWSSASTLNSPTVVYPDASPIVTTKYYVTVTDNALETAVDSMTVFVYASPQVNAGADTFTCFGSAIQLNAAVLPGFGIVPACTGTITSLPLGTDSTFHNQPLAQQPSLLGNYLKSYRNQMLYTASELAAKLGGARTISKIAFQLGDFGFNSNSILGNYTIKVGTTSASSLSTWDNSLITVYSGHSYTPHPYDNFFTLDSAFAWDGVSNLIVEVCVYSPSTSGNIPNQVWCTNTAFTSYLYDLANTDLCGTAGVAQTSALRPNIIFSYCNLTAINTYSWVPTVGLLNPTTATPTVSPTIATDYAVTVTDANGCSATDMVHVNVGIPGTLDTVVTHISCNGGNDGAIDITMAGGSAPFFYNWSQGSATEDLSNLNANLYAVTVTDASACTVTGQFTLNQPTALTKTISQTNPTCLAGGTATATVFGGTPPYYYSWSNGDTTSTADSLSPGIYTLTITDAHVCSVMGSVTMAQLSTGPVVSIVNNGDGIYPDTLSLNIIAGCAPFNYLWSTGEQNSETQAIVDGPYSVTVTDCSGCSTSASVSLSALTSSVITFNAQCFGTASGSVIIIPGGGTPPYLYSLNGGPLQSTNSFTQLSAGHYLVDITDDLSQTITDSFNILQPAELQTTVSIFPSSCAGGSCTGSLAINITGGVGPLYGVFLNDTTPAPTCTTLGCDLLCPGSYNLLVRDGNGCLDTTAFVINSADNCVWPGDADNNGLADNTDLLPIGLGYGSTGTARTDQTIAWSGHAAADWADTLMGGVNYVHIDCDGNGIINADDTLAVIQNFGLTHAKTDEQKPWRASDPALYVELAPDTTHAGDTMRANLILGDLNMPANNVYGLAFTVNYDVNVVDTLKTSAMFGASWLGTATDKISIAKDFNTTGKLKCALTRIDHATRSGNGQIGKVSFVITTDNINGKDISYYNLNVWISDLLVIDNQGNEIPVNEGQDSSLVEFEPLSVRNILPDGSLKMQPNPTADVVQLSVTSELTGAEIKLNDVNGRLLKTIPVTSQNFLIHTSGLESGIYFVQLISNSGTLTKRLMIAR